MQPLQLKAITTETETIADATTSVKSSLHELSDVIFLGGALVLGFAAGFALRGRALSLQKVASAEEGRGPSNNL
jgi:hypothetical protein